MSGIEEGIVKSTSKGDEVIGEGGPGNCLNIREARRRLVIQAMPG
jgi:hypothetical protein